MASGISASENPLVRFYRRYVGEPTTHDEVYGYLVFAVGIVYSLAGIGLFLTTIGQLPGPGVFAVREVALVLAGLGLATVLFGTIIRLPLRRAGLAVGILGALVCVAAVVLFVFAYPRNWAVSGRSGQAAFIVTLYTAGIGLVALAGVVVPLVTPRSASSTYRSEVYSEDDTWHWRVFRGETLVATSSRAFDSREAASEARTNTLRALPGATVTVAAEDDGNGDEE